VPPVVPPPAGLAPPELWLEGVLVIPRPEPPLDAALCAVVAAAVVLELVVVEELVVVLLTAALAEAPPGTVSCGASTVSDVDEVLPPQATSPTERAIPAANAASVGVKRFIERL
jgi:hypothetical protein